MDILILGGTGNISTDVAALLRERGHRVTLVTRGRSPIPAGYGRIQADRHDREGFCAAVAQWRGDAVIDFIAYKKEDCEIAYQALRGRMGQYVFISSTTVYEKPPSGKLPLTETTPLGNRFWEYARRKEECERWLLSACGADFPVTIVRPSHTLGMGWIPTAFGGSSDFTVASRILAGRPVVVPDDGQTLWTLTASSDFAIGLAGLLGNEKTIGEAFHITSDQPLTWNVIYYEIGLALGRAPEIVHIPTDFIAKEFPEYEGPLKGDKSNHAVFDNAKIKRFVPEFEAKKSLRQILRETVAWLNEDPTRKKIVPEKDRQMDAVIEKWHGQSSL
ncbi:MAG: NAD-dependent epimerase/dehydratase family protein [Candidatus Sumerlaeota bacterium]|nr:NAD-dependent epimerase/dehydratase family protein [Candidatus Sumerlaeota bacterium]